MNPCVETIYQSIFIQAKGRSAVGTLVERSTRYTVVLYLPNGHSAAEVQDAVIAKLAGLPDSLRLSLTWDQGSELAQHRKIASRLGLEVYFCDPHSPWQRGTNENANTRCIPLEFSGFKKGGLQH